MTGVKLERGRERERERDEAVYVSSYLLLKWSNSVSQTPRDQPPTKGPGEEVAERGSTASQNTH